MKIVIAPDSFKESLTALEAAEAIAEGLRMIWPEANLLLVPMADGGEGTVQAVVDAMQGELRETEVQGPLGQPTLAQWAYIPKEKTAVLEMAEASGLELIPLEERNPKLTSTYGTGELILATLDAKVERILIGLGGSATVDGGMGALAALGIRFFDAEGSELTPSGAALSSIARINIDALDPRLKTVELAIACDVNNPLLGEKGASAIYAPQKGASRSEVGLLESGMTNWAKYLPEEVVNAPGSGAAGGLAAGLLAFIGGKMLSGADFIAKLVDLDGALNGADLVITGEGAINEQTVHGKTPIGVAQRAKCPVVALTGALGEGFEKTYDAGIDVCWPIEPFPCTREQALREAKQNLTGAAERLARTLEIGKSL